MAFSKKKFINYENLQTYTQKMKEYITDYVGDVTSEATGVVVADETAPVSGGTVYANSQDLYESIDSFTEIEIEDLFDPDMSTGEYERITVNTDNIPEYMIIPAGASSDQTIVGYESV